MDTGADTDPYAFLESAMIKAEALLEQDDDHQAAQVLRRSLRDLDPATAPPNGWIMSAAMLFAQAADNTGDDASGQRWAWYAYHAALHIDGWDGQATGVAASVLATVLAEHGDTTPAIVLREVVAARHQQAGRHIPHVQARIALADTMHAAGSCGAAVHQATTALDTYLAGTDDEQPDDGGVWYLISVLRMLDLCGRTDEALALLEKWRPHLPTTDPGRTGAILLASFHLDTAPDDEAHQKVCAARLDRHLGLAADRPRVCPLHSPRPAEVRDAFFQAIGSPDDIHVRPVFRCACTPTGLRRFSLGAMLDALIPQLVGVRRRLAVRRIMRAVRAEDAARPPAPNASPRT